MCVKEIGASLNSNIPTRGKKKKDKKNEEG
jgi:hypothetical protein